jgi:hypothetical protein
MFDDAEPLIPLSQVPKIKWLPRRRGGKRLHPSTVFRWAQEGLRAKDGTLTKLATRRVGGTLCCTETALRAFFESLSRHDPSTAVQPPRSPSARTRAAERAGKELERIGI